MLIGVSVITPTFPSTTYPIKSLNSFLYTLTVSFSIIPNFMNIALGKRNTNVNFPQNDIMMTFFKY